VTYVASETDGLRHLRSWKANSAVVLTHCGKRVGPGEPGQSACHVCIPREAHPLAAVWDLCARWDANANVGAGEQR
jgi:hypothetical protein